MCSALRATLAGDPAPGFVYGANISTPPLFVAPAVFLAKSTLLAAAAALDARIFLKI